MEGGKAGQDHTSKTGDAGSGRDHSALVHHPGFLAAAGEERISGETGPQFEVHSPEAHGRPCGADGKAGARVHSGSDPKQNQGPAGERTAQEAGAAPAKKIPDAGQNSRDPKEKGLWVYGALFQIPIPAARDEEASGQTPELHSAARASAAGTLPAAV